MLELMLQVSVADPETLADSLLSQGALAVTLEDADLRSSHEKPIFAEPGMPKAMQAWPESTVTALLADGTDIEAFWQAASTADSRLCNLRFEVRQVADKDWVSETQKQFSPFQVGDALWVGPRWCTVPDDFRGVALHIDPGMAFGTGSHATTQLCLERITGHIRCARALSSVLDYGCGSGILAIAAARLGVRDVTALDIDPVALATCRRNADENDVALSIVSADTALDGTYDLVAANILAQPLKVLAPALGRLVAPGGGLLLSGILRRQADEIIEAYRPFTGHLRPMAVLGERDGWVCVGVDQTH